MHILMLQKKKKPSYLITSEKKKKNLNKRLPPPPHPFFFSPKFEIRALGAKLGIYDILIQKNSPASPITLLMRTINHHSPLNDILMRQQVCSLLVARPQGLWARLPPLLRVAGYFPEQRLVGGFKVN